MINNINKKIGNLFASTLLSLIVATANALIPFMRILAFLSFTFAQGYNLIELILKWNIAKAPQGRKYLVAKTYE